jgi:hypothetical protein
VGERRESVGEGEKQKVMTWLSGVWRKVGIHWGFATCSFLGNLLNVHTKREPSRVGNGLHAGIFMSVG